MPYIIANFPFRFKNLLKDEPMAKGRSVIFRISPNLKDELDVKKLNKRISKKERKLEILSKTTRLSYQEREKIIKRKTDLEKQRIQAESRIEEEKKEQT